jgi:hypothetical protein
VIDDDVACLTDGGRADNSLHRHYLSNMGLLSLEKLKGDVGLVPVRLSLEEILRLNGALGKGRATTTAKIQMPQL